MSVKKFRISHEGLPVHLLHGGAGEKVLRIRVTTRYGLRELALSDGMVIQTEDDLVIAQLTQYAPPRVPKIFRKGKEEKDFLNIMYAHEDHKDQRPFSLVDNAETHHIEL